MTDCIYGLVDPRSNEVRYIGKTNQKPSYRLVQHLHQAETQDGNSHLLNWLRQLLAEGLAPDIRILEVLEEWADWQERERIWIAQTRAAGWRLTNMTDGGEGTLNPSKEIRQQRSERMKGNTYAVGNRNAAGKRSQEFCERMAEIARQNKNALGHTVSQEARDGISESLKQFYQSGGERMAGEKNGQAKLTAERVREIRKRHAAGGISMRALGRQYGMSASAIEKVIHRETWKHVE
jgi:hypothetical protein